MIRKSSAFFGGPRHNAGVIVYAERAPVSHDLPELADIGRIMNENGGSTAPTEG